MVAVQGNIMIRSIISHLKHVVPPEELQPHVLLRSFAVMAWVSFLFAGIACMLFFASYDPVDLSQIATYPINLSPTTIYTLGFFLFWVFGFCCTAMSCVLLALPLAKRAKPMPKP
jgi:hypothetical protein